LREERGENLGSVNKVKVKLLLLFSLLGVLLVISTSVISSVFVKLISPSGTVPTSSISSNSTTVFVVPPYIINEALQSGSTFTVHVNISDVTDLFTWNINMSWDPSILNVNNLTAGEFLAGSVNQTSSEALGGVVINSTDNAEGYTSMAESILGDVSGETGSGRLVSIEFLVVGYGSTDLNISVSGTLPTVLLNSIGDSLAFNATGGYFRNKFPGDIDGDKDVDPTDFFAFAASYLKVSGQPGYNREADFDLDGDVDPTDFFAFAANYLKTFP
jgi:hypothetical protein